MKIFEIARRMVRSSEQTQVKADEILLSLANLSQLLNQRLTEAVQALDNQSRLVNQRLSETVQGIGNQSEATVGRLDDLIESVQSQSKLLSGKLDKLIDSEPHTLSAGNSSALMNERHSEQGQQISRSASDTRRNPVAGPKATILADDGPDEALPSPDENRLERYQYIFESVLKASEIKAPPGFLVDFMGILLDSRFVTGPGHDPGLMADASRRAAIPSLRENYNADSEWWFETVDWFVAALKARERFIMVSLGASYGAQLVGAYKALQMVNPLPSKFVAVEADPQSCDWIRQHFRTNGINPDDHWIVQAAVSDTDDPVLFPIGASGLGSNNCVSTNEPKAREIWIESIKRNGEPVAALENLIRYGSTGLMHDIGAGCSGEVKFVSAVTVADILSPFDYVDLLECDIQQSEIIALPPYLDLLRRKVKRIHIGTHGEDVHRSLYRMLAKAGWNIVFNYSPNTTHESPWGRFRVNDGVLTAQNPSF